MRGGQWKAYASVGPLANDPLVAGLDLETAEGLRGLLAATLHALAKLPLDVRSATCVGQLATAQRGILEGADFEKRLAALEAAATGR